jgi:hypothetical protein
MKIKFIYSFFLLFLWMGPLCAVESPSTWHQVDVLLKEGEYEKAEAFLKELLNKQESLEGKSRIAINLIISLYHQKKWQEALDLFKTDYFQNIEGEVEHRKNYLFALTLFKRSLSSLEEKEGVAEQGFLKELQSSVQQAIEILKGIPGTSKKHLNKELWVLLSRVLIAQEKIKEEDFAYLREKVHKKIVFWQSSLGKEIEDLELEKIREVLDVDLKAIEEGLGRLKGLAKEKEGKIWGLFQDLIEEAKEGVIGAQSARSPSLVYKSLSQSSYLLSVLPFTVEKNDPLLKALEQSLGLSKTLQQKLNLSLEKSYKEKNREIQSLTVLLKRILNRSVRSLDPKTDIDDEQERGHFFLLRYHLMALEDLEVRQEKLIQNEKIQMHFPFLQENIQMYRFLSSTESGHFISLLDLLDRKEKGVSFSSGIFREGLQALVEKFELRKDFFEDAASFERVKEVIFTLEEAQKELDKEDDGKALTALLKGAFLTWDALDYLSYLLDRHKEDLLQNVIEQDEGKLASFWKEMQEESETVKNLDVASVELLDYLLKSFSFMQDVFIKDNGTPSSFDVSQTESFLQLIRQEKTQENSLRALLSKIVELQGKAILEKPGDMKAHLPHLTQRAVLLFSDYLENSFYKEKEGWSLPLPFESSMEIHQKAKSSALEAELILEKNLNENPKVKQKQAEELWKSLLDSPESGDGQPPSNSQPSPGGQASESESEAGEKESEAGENQRGKEKEEEGSENEQEGSPQEKNKEAKGKEKNIDPNLQDIDNKDYQPSYSWPKDLLDEIKDMEREDAEILKKKRSKPIRKGFKPW